MGIFLLVNNLSCCAMFKTNMASWKMAVIEIAYYLFFAFLCLIFLYFGFTIALIFLGCELFSSYHDENDEDCEQQWDQILESAMPLTQQPNFCEEISSDWRLNLNIRKTWLADSDR